MSSSRSIEPSHDPPSTSNQNNNHNFVAHIRGLLPIPKHATFRVKLVIHQLSCVPFVSGDFRVKWKFKNIQVVSSDGRPIGLGRTLALKLDTHKKKRSNGTTNTQGADLKGKGKERQVSSNTTPMRDEGDDIPFNGLSSSPTTESTLFNTPENERPTSEPSHSKQSISSTKSDSVRSETLEGGAIHFHTETRGYTPYHPLDHFKVNFETEVNAAVQMNIERDSLALLPSELKLTVSQLVIPGDPAAPPNPRLGHVLINLAEYANVGPVTRNYLLRRSKVNALLKLTLTVTQIGGEENYIAPPLRKEEIKAGIADYLSSTSYHIPFFSEQEPLDDPWLATTFYQIIPPSPPPSAMEDETLISMRADPSPPELRTKKGWKKAKTVESPRPPPKPLKSRSMKSLSPTELLIEAIFNPYPSTSDEPSPFTYRIPHIPSRTLLDSTSDTNSTHASMESSQQGNDSVRSGATSSNGQAARSISGSAENNIPSGTKWWKRRQTSRPVTPASTRT